MGFVYYLLKRHVDLVHPGKNRYVREILRNLISCLEDWDLEKNNFHEKSKPQIGVRHFLIKLVWLLIFYLVETFRHGIDIVDDINLDIDFEL